MSASFEARELTGLQAMICGLAAGAALVGIGAAGALLVMVPWGR